MPKISTKLSVTLSFILTILCLAVLVAAGATVYNYPVLWLRLQGADLRPDPGVVAFAYGEILAAFAAAVLLLALLNRIRRREVFIPANVGALRGISWCCFGEALLFAAEAVYIRSRWIPLREAAAEGVFFRSPGGWILFGAAAFGFVFIGLILRVVKNTMEEAVALKTENDYTI